VVLRATEKNLGWSWKGMLREIGGDFELS
jgi:hypothetical protein